MIKARIFNSCLFNINRLIRKCPQTFESQVPVLALSRGEGIASRVLSCKYRLQLYPIHLQRRQDSRKCFASFTDVDNDNLIDLLVGTTDGTVERYEQSSVNSLSFNQVVKA